MSVRNVLDRNANAATLSPADRRLVNAIQQQILNDFHATYGIAPEQISFDARTGEAIFDFDALSVLALALTDIQDIEVEFAGFEPAINLATSRCFVSLPDGRSRKMFGTAMIGEELPENRTVTDVTTAVAVSRARALRVGLRAVGFDPISAHKQKKAGQTPTLSPERDTVHSDIQQIHILAKDIGLIGPSGDDSRYRKLISVFFPGIHTSKNLNDKQRSQLITTLRALKQSGEATAYLETEGIPLD